MAEKVTTDTILNYLKERAQSKESIPSGIWLDAAFKLNLLLEDEEIEMRNLSQTVSKKKLDIMKVQDKRNVSAADLEIQCSDEFRTMCNQEDKVDRIKEFIRIAKKNAEQGY